MRNVTAVSAAAAAGVERKAVMSNLSDRFSSRRGDEMRRGVRRAPGSVACRRALRWKWLALPALTVLLLSACSGVKVRTDYDPAADFTTLHTYAWLPTPREKTGDPRIDDPLINSRIERSIDSALATKGFAKVEADQADFHVTFYVGIDRKLDVTTMPRAYGYYGAWGGVYGATTTYVDQYDVGTLLIDVIDRARNQLVWRGIGEARLRQSRTPEESERRIQKTVDAIFKSFPPGRAQ